MEGMFAFVQTILRCQRQTVNIAEVVGHRQKVERTRQPFVQCLYLVFHTNTDVQIEW